MGERSAVVLGAAVGAALGSLAGYLFLTERGRRLRQDFEPKLDELMRDLVQLRGTIARARAAAAEGLRVVSDVTGERRNWSEPAQRARR